MIKRYKNPQEKRKYRVRLKLKGTALRPRLTVHRTLRYIYAQIIDDQKAVTLASAFGSKPESVGTEIATKALKKKILNVVFDRGPYRYLGQIKRLADSAREKGLKF